jgi:hypothetical protein
MKPISRLENITDYDNISQQSATFDQHTAQSSAQSSSPKISTAVRIGFHQEIGGGGRRWLTEDHQATT